MILGCDTVGKMVTLSELHQGSNPLSILYQLLLLHNSPLSYEGIGIITAYSSIKKNYQKIVLRNNLSNLISHI